MLGILTASSATGQLVFLPLAANLIQQHGWRVAVAPVVIGCLSVAGLALCFLRERPRDLGLIPYGADPLATNAVPVWRPSFAEPLSVLAGVSRHSAFWLLFGTFFVCGLSTSGLIQKHFISLCGDYGMAAVPAASVLAMIGAFDSSAQSVVFDKKRTPMIFGWIFAGHQLGSATAAYGAGLTRTVMLTYSPALYAAGIACLIAALSIFWVRWPSALPLAAPQANARMHGQCTLW